jgi:hypothetical protein
VILEKQMSQSNLWLLFVLWRPQGDRRSHSPLNPAPTLLNKRSDTRDGSVCVILRGADKSLAFPISPTGGLQTIDKVLHFIRGVGLIKG